MPAARVLIDGPSELVFDYAIPDGLNVQPGCRVRIPLRNKLSQGTVLDLVPQQDDLGFALRPLHSLSDPEPLITPNLLKAGRWIADYYGCSIESVIRALLPEAVRTEDNSAKVRKTVVLDHEPSPETLAKLQKRAPKQAAILSLLTHAPERKIALADLGDGASASVKSLAKQEFVRVLEEEVRRDPEADGVEEILPDTPLPLNDEQEASLEIILSSLQSAENKQPILLHGVTGSGKTEVYLQSTRAALDMGKTVLVLVPEISLTPQTVRRFRARFAGMQDQVAVLHSNLSQGERFDEWHRIRKGIARIVIGARSAVFAPLPDLGLILVDEEHENSYKQDQIPRYHGRDVAVLRAALEGCTIVLGSATPSLESFQNTLEGKYRLVRLAKRADGQSLPLIRVLDMRLEKQKQKGGMAILSDRLRNALEQRLLKNEQSILFLNRRGFARSLQCPSCGAVCMCPHCSVALTYHRDEERLMCHICGHQAVVPRKCPECRDPAIALQGYGTQKVEEIIAKVLPNAKVARIDADAMRKKHALRDLLNAFQARKIDILIGTQMIAKGLHFPNVTLVGILNADIGLHVPDFRAGERVFQLLTQVAGRAGRGDLEGEVIVQTFTPHSPSIQFARHHDFDGFAEQELEFRRQFSFPPFSHCAVLTSRSTHERRAEFTLQTLHRRLTENTPPDIIIGDPLPSPLVKTHGQFRFQLMLRSTKARPMTRHVQQVLQKTTLPEDVTVVFDMDAWSFT
ncbi:primosomal protein N' [Luteolibacter flavescens]|uniref:Replication restart protein PriA n=1 Tax=Luteolibacter flavescens TaxID=1859460 RepID=A0ABT3FLX7_9BACT|nr:primosomal protein N' [Luteolibacter flavescens]MCW1884585.1 primosomal protein N' [Luteolibacter flavescens]